MSNIYEALEQAQRENNRTDSGGMVPLPGDDPVKKSPLLRGRAVRPARVTEEAEMATLYRTIDLLLPEQNRKTIQFISSRQGEGVSTVVREIAKTAASKLGKKVLVLDAALHNPTQHLLYAGSREPGVQNLQKDGRPLNSGCFQTVGGNLCIASLPASAANSCFVDIKSSIAFLDELKKKFDLILIDSSPVSITPDSVALAQHVDGVILVLEAEKTKWFVAENLKEKILKNGGNILGVVFNKRRYHIPKCVYEWL